MANDKDVFDEVRNLIEKRKQAYIQVLGIDGEFVKEIMGDLERFCRGSSSCFHIDGRVHAVLEGRREVWLRIQQHLKLSNVELHNLYTTEKGRN